MRVYLFAGEACPVYYIRPKEVALELSDIIDIPISLINRYKAVTEEYNEVQKLLKEYL